ASTPFRNADDFVGFVRAAENRALLLPKLVAQFGLFGALRLLGKLVKSLKEPVLPLAATRFYSAVPIKFGPYAAHYALVPHDRAEDGTSAKSRPDYLGEDLAERLRREPVSYDFQLQFFRDETLTPIEDGSVEWREADAPFITIGRLTLPQQDTGSPRGRRIAEFVESLSFDPWHATGDFRPLGNMMRARRHAYRLSSIERGAVPEPDGSERFA
ncbi:MAG: catalase, partial [Nevskiales bacterium]